MKLGFVRTLTYWTTIIFFIFFLFFQIRSIVSEHNNIDSLLTWYSTQLRNGSNVNGNPLLELLSLCDVIKRNESEVGSNMLLVSDYFNTSSISQ